MKQIESKYIINKETVAILPAKQIEYHAVVTEGNQTVFVRQTPLELVKAACLANWCTYEGRRQAVMHHTGFKQKVPIPISINHEIFAFPTHAQLPPHLYLPRSPLFI